MILNIKSKVAVKILGYFLVNQDAQHYVNELARTLDLDPSNTDGKLKELEQEGILTSEIRGNQRYYFLNKKYPLLGEVKKLYDTSYGLPARLGAELKNLPGLEEAYVYGSYAKGNFSGESDIDLLLIGEHSSMEANRCLIKFGREFGREFNCTDMSSIEYEKRKKNNDEFIKEVFRGATIRII